MTALEKYIWIVRTLYNKGDRGLSLKELNDKWIHDENINNGEPLPRQTFDRWKGNILMILGVNTECRLKGGYRYYISNPECLSKGGLIRWLLDTYSTANTLSQSTQLKDRILVEEIPSNRNYLTDIIEAMKNNHVVALTYKSFIHGSSHTFSVEPYSLKMFKKDGIYWRRISLITICVSMGLTVWKILRKPKSISRCPRILMQTPIFLILWNSNRRDHPIATHCGSGK